MRIVDIKARTILSSLGNETVEVEVTGENEEKATASIPAGISAGKYEVVNVSANQAVQQIENIKRELIGREIDQQRLDDLLCGSGMGGNATLAISAATWKAELIKSKKKYNKFPKLLTLMFEGGKHGNENITVQEFAVIENSVWEAAKDFKKLKEYLMENHIENTVGAEGAFSPMGFDNWKAMDVIKKLFENKTIALDVAGSFVEGDVDYEELLKKYNIASIEDPYSDEEWERWADFYAKFGKKILVVGDDLTVSNPSRIKMALNPRVINAVIIKPNQNGTISGTLEAVKLAMDNDLKLVVSHRAEETSDDWICDFALEIGADFVKFGGLERGERVAKYNRLRVLGMK